MGARNAATEPYVDFRFDSDDVLHLYEYSGGYTFRYKTTRVFRDCSGWYHFVVACDTTQAVASDRMKIYVNGVEETDFSVETDPAEDLDTSVNVSGYLCTVASLGNSGTGNFNGAMSHLYFIDGLAYAPTVFGEVDSDTGEWKIKTSPSVTYGTNGFLILKDGNTITDQGDNSNDFTLGAGTLTDLQDCPSDVFATYNPLANWDDPPSFSNGNNTVALHSAAKAGGVSTIGINKGKFYCEMKLSASSDNDAGLGIFSDLDEVIDDIGPGESANSYCYRETGVKINNSSETAYGDSYTVGDIISMALDCDNNKLYFAKNGAWQDSGDPTSGATGTGAISITDPASTVSQFYFPCGSCTSASQSCTWDANFGNGYFGTTAISSEGTNASNIGKFEYDVPAGYTALSTKGLNNNRHFQQSIKVVYL